MQDLFFENTRSKSRRLKDDRLISRRDAEAGHVDIRRVDSTGVSKMPEFAIEFCRREIGENEIGTVAVLCRTNAEVAELYLSLKEVVRNVTLQAGTRVRLSDLRHLGMLADILRFRVGRDADVYLSEKVVNELCSELDKSGVVESRFPISGAISGRHVFQLAFKEFARPRLSDVIDLLDDTDLDEAERILGLDSEGGEFVIVSTIHKVKGLEFDSVFIAASGSPFLGENGHEDPTHIADLSAEEARLYYVGMTRAKTRLQCFLGPREHAWWGAHPYSGNRGNRGMLTGSHDEVVISWAMQESSFNHDPDDCQEYIETEVRVGDRIILGGSGVGSGRALFHRPKSGALKQIGFLSDKAGSGGAASDVIVSAVVRKRIDEGDERQEKWGRLSDLVQSRGWGYTVLVTGIVDR